MEEQRGHRFDHLAYVNSSAAGGVVVGERGGPSVHYGSRNRPAEGSVGRTGFGAGGDPPYTFVTDGIEHAVEEARTAASDKDVSVMGATIVQQCLRAGLLDEIIINLVSVVLGRGVRLLDNLEPGSIQLELVGVVDAPGVTHLRYRVVK